MNGGSLGWSTPNVYAPGFRDQIDRLALNTLSQPFETQFGWHILEVLGKRQHDNSLEARRNQIRDYLRQRKIEEETELWQRQLRDESYVENRVFNDDS